MAAVDVVQGERGLTDELRFPVAVCLGASNIHNPEPGVEISEILTVLRNQVLFDFALVFRTIEILPLCFRERAI
ncbi:hypothetical protein [Streptomyces sp. NPDC048445]|uniref:hypothetical protein n=1 Tax=Streptomyces sp. NPDC048445 TaxID=3365553 RepID=UPI00371CD653